MNEWMKIITNKRNWHVTGHTLDRLLYLNVYWKKSVIHHILLTWHQVITIIVSKFEETFFMDRDFDRQWAKYATEEWLKEQSKLFCFTGIQKLPDHYKLCIDKGSGYVKHCKLMLIHLTFI